MFKTLMLATVLLPSIAFGQSSTSRSFYDRNGSFAGSSVTRGNSTSIYDRNGRFDGSAIKNNPAVSPGRAPTRRNHADLPTQKERRK